MKENRKKMVKLLILAISLCLWSCSSESEPSMLTVSTNHISVTAEGGTEVVSVTSNTDWTVAGGASWLSLSPSAGSKNGSSILSISVNKEFSSRNCSLTYTTSDGKASQTVVIEQQAKELEFSINVYELKFMETENDVQTLQITSNTDWSISGVPDWLNLSSSSGSGNATVNLKTTSFNNSSSARTAVLVVTANGLTKEVNISQNPGLSSDCVVKLDKFVTLSDALAFNFEYESAVSYFYVGYLDKSNIGRMTDDEIIRVLEDNFERYTPSDDYVLSFSGLASVHDYVVYTIAYDKNGKRGELYSKELSTKSGTNQAVAYVQNVKYDSSKWYFDTVIGAYAEKYYKWTMTGVSSTSFSNYSNGIIAWYFMHYIETDSENYKPVLQTSSWSRVRDAGDKCIQIVTWGVDAKGEFGGVITNYVGYAKSSSSTVETAKNTSFASASSQKAFVVKKEALIKDIKVERF